MSNTRKKKQKQKQKKKKNQKTKKKQKKKQKSLIKLFANNCSQKKNINICVAQIHANAL